MYLGEIPFASLTNQVAKLRLGLYDGTTLPMDSRKLIGRSIRRSSLRVGSPQSLERESAVAPDHSAATSVHDRACMSLPIDQTL